MRKRAVLLAFFCLFFPGCSSAGLNSGLQLQPHRIAPASTASALYVAYDALITSGGIVPPAIVAYPLGAPLPAEKIAGNVHAVSALAFNSAGSFYVAALDAQNKGCVLVYAPGTTSPQQTIHKGAAAPTAMVFDRSGNLYVANYSRSGGFVSVYAPNDVTPARTITNGVSGPQSLAYDTAGDLFVANLGSTKIPSSVTIYAPGKSTPAQTVTKGVQNPGALAFDRASNLYVVNPVLTAA